MGSVVVSDVVSDFARYPRNMVLDRHEIDATATERRQSSSTRGLSSQSSLQSSYSHPRFSSATAVATLSSSSTSNLTALGRQASHPSQTSASSDRVESHGPSIHRAMDGSTTSTPTSSNLNPKPVEQTGLHREEQGYDRSGFPLTSVPRGLAASPPSPRLLPRLMSAQSLYTPGQGSPNRIKVRDLSHIHSFASEEVLTRSRHGSRRSLRIRPEGGQQYEISAMPVTDIIEMVAGLLTKITTTNDRQHQHEQINRHVPAQEGASALNQQTASVLSFHGKNVPSITILSYLSRIHKYCPTTYEVFLSLLVYFDRMTEMINSGTLRSFHSAAGSTDCDILTPASTTSFRAAQVAASTHNQSLTPPPSGSMDPQEPPGSPPSSGEPGLEAGDESGPLGHYFVVDSFNIHRLVIAGVTCASKFFSDVFYTNSRYAKVRPFLKVPPFCLPHRIGSKFAAHLTLLFQSTGRRPPHPRAQPPRAPVPPAQRLPPLGTSGGAGGLWEHAGRVLCAGGYGTAEWWRE